MTCSGSCSPRMLLTTAVLLAAGTIAASAQERLPSVDFRFLTGHTGEFWPGDFDDDGETDLAARDASSGRLAILPGHGDGSFGPPILSDTDGWPLGAADLNGDGRLDVIAEAGSNVVVLPGNGDGTLGSPRTVLAADAEFVRVADMDVDGHLDVVIGEQAESLHVVPGNGDFTFRSPVTLTTAPWPHGAAIADLNEDGQPDVVVAHRYDHRLIMFRNDGGLLFTPVDLPIDASSTGVVARDLNGDDRVDLAVSVRGPSDDGPWEFGAVYVYAGNGDGTFAAPRAFPTAVGPHSVAVGDFTHDGTLDLATSNGAQYLFLDNSCGEAVGPHAASILPGNGDGTFGPPTTFELRNRDSLVGARNLNAADLDDDGFPDLLVGWKSILLTNAPRANQPPVLVDAGNDRVVRNAPEVLLRGRAVDPDGHYLTYAWSDGGAGGDFYAPVPDTCYAVHRTGVFRLTLTADDGHGGVASDSVNISKPAEDGPDLTGTDVFDPGAPGSFTYEDGTYTVRGNGEDIWGVEDDFYFVHGTWSGDFDVTAHVTSVENVHRWTKAGIMIRAGASPEDVHASVFATPTTEKGIAFQRRPPDDDPGVENESVHTPGPAVAPPVWLRLSRRGATMTAWYRKTAADAWTAIGSDSVPMPDSVRVGLAVTSHVSGTLATATFEEFTVSAPGGGDPGGLPEGWSCGDVGDVGAPGNCTYRPLEEDDSSDGWSLRGSGADIWGTSDEFTFAATQMSGDFSIAARVASVESVNRWTKAGIMIRTSDDDGARHASFFVTPGVEKGTAFQRRPVEGGTSVHTAGPVTTAPFWVRLTRTGDVIRAYYRKEITDPWRFLAMQAFTALPDRLSAMIVVSSHVDGALASAEFSHVTVERVHSMQSVDIGTTTSGSTVSDGTIVSMEGNGADIWGTADAFRLHYVRWSGDGTITARVRSLEDTHRWAKAGVMFRESLTPGSKHVMAIVSSSMGLALQSRAATGGISASTTPVPGSAPAWIRLHRFGDRFSAEFSEDGEFWFWHAIGEVTVSMNSDVYVGLPVTSHSSGTLATAVFDDVVIEP